MYGIMWQFLIWCAGYKYAKYVQPNLKCWQPPLLGLTGCMAPPPLLEHIQDIGLDIKILMKDWGYIRTVNTWIKESILKTIISSNMPENVIIEVNLMLTILYIHYSYIKKLIWRQIKLIVDYFVYRKYSGFFSSILRPGEGKCQIFKTYGFYLLYHMSMLMNK